MEMLSSQQVNWVGLVAFVLLLSTLFIFTRPKNAVEVDAKLDK